MNKLALCVGINDYPGRGNDLSGCINDVDDWTRLLQAYKFRVEQLKDGEATLSNIRSHLKRMLLGAIYGDLVVFQFSGHGSFVPDLDGDEADGVDECLVPYDFEDGVLIDDELSQIFADKPPGVRAVFIADCCHSGTVCRFFTLAPSSATRRVRFMSPGQFMTSAQIKSLGPSRRNFGHTMVSKVLQNRSPMLLLAGCQDKEYSYDAHFNGRPNGVFTKTLIKHIADNGIKPMSYQDLQRQVQNDLPNNEYPQTPNFVGTKEQLNWTVLG